MTIGFNYTNLHWNFGNAVRRFFGPAHYQNNQNHFRVQGRKAQIATKSKHLEATKQTK